MTHTQQRSTSISTTNHPNPAIRYLIGSSWVGLSNRLCLVSNKKSCGYIQTNQLTQKGKKAAVLKEVDVATQPVGQIWWVRTWIKARKQENPTEHVWRESGRNWERNGPPKIAKNSAQLEELKAHNLLKELSSWTSEHLPVSSGMSALLL